MARDPHRYRLARAGVLNVWQYDEQVFVFADGRLLLRGTNGAGKSKTLEMLLPFALDGDKARMTATGRQGSQLLWLMSDGASGTGTRLGYLWVELARLDPSGEAQVVTCGIGLRYAANARTVSTWQFTVPGGVPDLCEPDGAPLSAPRCRELVESLGGSVFDSPRAYKEHVGRLLFGLEPQAYDDLLRLLYWLRQPQVGEDIDPARLVAMLDEALPALDDEAVRQVGEAFDDLAEHGERVEKLDAAAAAVAASATVYRRYAATVVQERTAAALAAEKERAARARAVGQETGALEQVIAELAHAETEQRQAGERLAQASSRVSALESGPLARNQQVLREKQRRASDLTDVATRAREAAVRATDRADNARARVEREARDLAEQGRRFVTSAGEVDAGLRGCGLAGALPAGDDPVAFAESLVEAVPAARHRVTTVRAAVSVVRDAVGRVEQQTGARDAAAERAAEAERREEQAAGSLADAAREVTSLAESWSREAFAWAAERPDLAEELEIPAPTPIAVEAVAEQARAVAAPVLLTLRNDEAEAAARRVAAQTLLRELADRHAAVLAETDPAPPGPALPRPGRDPQQGLPLWRMVDVRDGVDAAPIEAALQAAGLLDAQVLADGSVLAADTLDTVLLPTRPVDGPTLGEALRPDVPEGSPVTTEVVAGVLATVALLDRVNDAGGPAAIGRDGSWRLGPLRGRADKPVAQYVGSAARVAERARRLAAVEAEQVAATADLDAATGAERAAAQERTALLGWLDRLPALDALRAAWVRRDERSAARDRAQAEATAASERLTAATAELARDTRALQRLCAEHDLPADRDALELRGATLTDLDVRLEGLRTEATRLLAAARRLEEDGEAAERDADDSKRADAEADTAERDAREAMAEHQALLDTLGVEVKQMQADLEAAQQAQRQARGDRQRADHQVLDLTGRRGAALSQVVAAEQRLAEALPELTEQASRVAALRGVPGLLDAALDRPLQESDHAGLAALPTLPLPRVAVQLLAAWSEPRADRPADANDVHAEVRSLAAGPAADAEPRVVPVGEALAVMARDPAGAEQPLALAALRLAEEAVRERELLTDRERTLFEEHLLGELGDKLRARRAEATDLVKGMNDLLADVKTSQGIRVRLDWSLREDAGQDVHDAVALLGRAHGSLTPEERTRLRDVLSALIAVQRDADPERGYTEHLARALDYRRWSAFAVRLHRPGATAWTTLTRRTPLSQGEQKIVCYLPLFAAAAAHFTSVAGAAPWAPRLILLDDAFPKIDVRTHPLLFGLLVDLDLDFVLTSERLWGDHPTVPSLAIYEALRAPGERGIAQYRYTWDGHALVGEG